VVEASGPVGGSFAACSFAGATICNPLTLNVTTLRTAQHVAAEKVHETDFRRLQHHDSPWQLAAAVARNEWHGTKEIGKGKRVGQEEATNFEQRPSTVRLRRLRRRRG
jgi:hypothetical protein